MKLIKRGKYLKRIWRGSCRECGSSFEAEESEVKQGKIEYDVRDGEAFAHRDCPECLASAGCAVILYPIKA